MNKLEVLREEIDRINSEIIFLLQKRLKVTLSIAALKKEEKLPLHDPKREKIELEKIRKMALKNNLSMKIMEEIFQIIISYSKEEMQKEMEDNDECDYLRS